MNPAPGAKVSCRLFVTDLDGTILVDEGPQGARLPERTRLAMQRLSARGVTVCLASGRMHESITAVAKSWGFSGPVISYNGAMVRLESGELFSHEPLDSAVSDQVIDFAEANSLALNFYEEGRVLSRRFHPWWDLYEGRTCSPMVEVPDLKAHKGTSPTKLLIMAEPARIRELEAHFKPLFEGRANVLISGDEYLEFMSPRVNKGAALLALAARLGIAKEDIVAAGDGYNDIEMLQAAGHAVAIHSGRQAAKDAAHRVVQGPEAWGVAEFIENFLLDPIHG